MFGGTHEFAQEFANLIQVLSHRLGDDADKAITYKFDVLLEWIEDNSIQVLLHQYKCNYFEMCN